MISRNLARPGLVVGQEHIARKLLRDRRSALREAAARIANLKRAGDAQRIDPEVAAKTLVLDGDHRGLHRRRNLVDRSAIRHSSAPIETMTVPSEAWTRIIWPLGDDFSSE